MKSGMEKEMERAKTFFEEHKINPVLPRFGSPKEVLLFNQLPNLICIRYDEDGVKQEGKDSFYKTLKEKTETTGCFETYIAKDGSYYLRMQQYGGLYHLYIQAIKEKGEEPKIPSTYGLFATFVDLDGFDD